MADHLRDYAATFELPVRLGTRVEQLTRSGGAYALHTTSGTVRARRVVVATGPFQRPAVPELATTLDAGVTQLHSSAHRNPAQLPAGPVLVVGDGNPGRQIAAELADRITADLPTTAAYPRRFSPRAA